MRTPERRTFTGCRCRISEPRTARTRLRLVFGTPTRKTDFQICELTMFSWIALTLAMSPLGLPVAGCRLPVASTIQQQATGNRQLKPHERFRIRPLSSFLMELLRLVDDALSVRR